MSKFISLLKASMSGGVQLFNYKGKTERSRIIMPIVLGLLIGGLMLLSALVLVNMLKKDGNEVAILAIYTLVTSMIIVMEGSYKAIDLLFKPRDNDMLLAMPIKRSSIVFARMIKFYLFELVYCLIFLLPAMIAYAVNVAVEPSYYLVALTMLILVPVIPIAVACLFGLIIAAVSGRFKHKTLWQVILSFAVLFFSAGLVFAFNNPSVNLDGSGLTAISDQVTEFYYPASVLVRLATHFDALEYLLFVAINLVVVVATVSIIGRFCFKIITKLDTVSYMKKTEVNYRFARRSQVAAMVRKEVTRYFNTPVLLMNTAIGLVFFLVAVGLLCFQFDNVANSIMSSVEDFPLSIEELHSYLPGVTMAMVAFASLLTCITATMISLEGKAFNVLKTLPISGTKVIMSKVLAAMLLIVPVTLVGVLVMAIRFRFGILETILVLVSVVAMPLVTELIGILINLKYPRFDADNDSVVVKQSASVMVATFLGLGMVLLTISLIFAAVFWMGQMMGLLIVDGIYVTFALILYFVVATRGEKKYLKLVA